MSFRNPPLTLPTLARISLATPNEFYLVTPLFSVGTAPSLLIAPKPAVAAFAELQVTWYGDPRRLNLIANEVHPVPGTGLPFALSALLLTQAKGPYCQVMCLGSTSGTVDVYASSTPVVGWQRLDSRDAPQQPSCDAAYAGVLRTAIPVSQLTTTDTLYGYGSRSSVTVIAQIVASSSNVGTTTLTPTFTVKTPQGLTVGTVTGPAIATPAAGATLNTAPITIPDVPAGQSFELDLAYTLGAATATRSYSVTAYAY